MNSTTIKFFSFSLVALLVCSMKLSLAQEDLGQANELDKMYVPDKNSIFNSDAKTNSSGNDDSSPIDIKNNISFNPTLLSRSVLALFYERFFGDQYSIKGGLGVCYEIDKIQSIAYDVGFAGEFFSEPTSTVSITRIMQEGIFQAPRLYSSISVRVHWDSFFGGSWNPYFEINAQQSFYTLKMNASSINYNEIYSNYNYGNSNNTSGLIGNRTDVSIRNTSINLIYGTQFVTSGKIKTTHDFFIGIGGKKTSYNQFQTGLKTISDPTKTRQDLTIQVEESKYGRESVLIPSVLLGYSFGFGF